MCWMEEMRALETKRRQEGSVRFICKICGIRSPEPILCVKTGCPTEALVCDAASVARH
jgi:hypothetical protein